MHIGFVTPNNQILYVIRENWDDYYFHFDEEANQASTYEGICQKLKETFGTKLCPNHTNSDISPQLLRKITRKHSQEFKQIDSEMMDNIFSLFEDDKSVDIILPLTKSMMGISLRQLEWFVNNCSKIELTSTNFKNINTAYKNQRNIFGKENFDIYCRFGEPNKIVCVYDDKKFTTTFAQLNFFGWALKNNLVDLVHKHSDKIRSSMVSDLRRTLSNHSIPSAASKPSDNLKRTLSNSSLSSVPESTLNPNNDVQRILGNSPLN